MAVRIQLLLLLLLVAAASQLLLVHSSPTIHLNSNSWIPRMDGGHVDPPPPPDKFEPREAAVKGERREGLMGGDHVYPTPKPSDEFEPREGVRGKQKRIIKPRHLLTLYDAV